MAKGKNRRSGSLAGRGEVIFTENFKFTTEEFLNL